MTSTSINHIAVSILNTRAQLLYVEMMNVCQKTVCNQQINQQK